MKSKILWQPSWRARKLCDEGIDSNRLEEILTRDKINKKQARAPKGPTREENIEYGFGENGEMFATISAESGGKNSFKYECEARLNGNRFSLSMILFDEAATREIQSSTFDAFYNTKEAGSPGVKKAIEEIERTLNKNKRAIIERLCRGY